MTYQNPATATDVIIQVGDEIVLIERANPPHGWALPGGFIDLGEAPEDAARREAKEETGLDVELVTLLGVYGDPARDPRKHTLGIVYVARARGTPVAGDDAARARTFRLDALPERLCFDHHTVLEDYRRWRAQGQPPTPTPPRGPVLLNAARDAIAAILESRGERIGHGERHAFATLPGAAFVTLRVRESGRLRGCIGELEACRPLVDSVRQCAVGAALRDPRFPPLAHAELAAITIGISVLTSPQPLATPQDLTVGRHGLIVRRGHARGVLLPEVPVEAGWDREAFLSGTCAKAGLAADAWTDAQTVLSVFETVKFQEP